MVPSQFGAVSLGLTHRQNSVVYAHAPFALSSCKRATAVVTTAVVATAAKTTPTARACFESA